VIEHLLTKYENMWSRRLVTSAGNKCNLSGDKFSRGLSAFRVLLISPGAAGGNLSLATLSVLPCRSVSNYLFTLEIIALRLPAKVNQKVSGLEDYACVKEILVLN
jgi:hypothetical protein